MKVSHTHGQKNGRWKMEEWKMEDGRGYSYRSDGTQRQRDPIGTVVDIALYNVRVRGPRLSKFYQYTCKKHAAPCAVRAVHMLHSHFPAAAQHEGQR